MISFNLVILSCQTSLIGYEEELLTVPPHPHPCSLWELTGWGDSFSSSHGGVACSCRSEHNTVLQQGSRSEFTSPHQIPEWQGLESSPGLSPFVVWMRKLKAGREIKETDSSSVFPVCHPNPDPRENLVVSWQVTSSWPCGAIPYHGSDGATKGWFVNSLLVLLEHKEHAWHPWVSPATPWLCFLWI